MGRLLLSMLLVVSSAGSIPEPAWAQLSPAAPTAAAIRASAVPIPPVLSDEIDPPFNNNNTPLNDQEFLLLNQNGYRIQADGTIRAPRSLRPLGQAELQTDIEQLTGRKRLKAMLELDLVFSKFGYKNLPPDALADVRRVARQNWPLLPEQVRADLRQYFSGPELESIDQGVKVVRAPATWMPLEAMDIPPEALSASAIPSVRSAPSMAPSVVISPMAAMKAEAQSALSAVGAEATGPPDLAAVPKPATALQPTAIPAANPTVASPVPATANPISPAPTPAASVAAVPAAAPSTTAQTPTPPAPTSPTTIAALIPSAIPNAAALQAPPPAAVPPPPAPAPAGAPPPPQPASPSQQPAPGFKTTDASEAPRLQVAAAVPATPAPQPPAAKPAIPSPPPTAAAVVPQAPATSAPTLARYGDISPEDFDRFLRDAPYGHEAQAMLKMISEHAPSDIRRQALGQIISRVPLVVIDPARAGLQPYAAVRRIHDDPSKPGQYLIILNPGPILLRKRSVFFASRQYFMPEDPAFYRDLGVAPPGAKALDSGAAADAENMTEWGMVREYSDGSERLKYSEEQLAGTLLGEIIKLDFKPVASASDDYRLALLARSAQFQFYRKFKEDKGTDPLLDQNLRAEYAEWLARPEDAEDFLIESMAAPTEASLVPSLSGSVQDRAAWARHHDLSVLDQAGVDVPKDAKKSLETLPADIPNASSASMDQSVLRDLQALETNSPVNAAWLGQEQKFRSEFNAPK